MDGSCVCDCVCVCLCVFVYTCILHTGTSSCKLAFPCHPFGPRGTAGCATYGTLTRGLQTGWGGYIPTCCQKDEKRKRKKCKTKKKKRSSGGHCVELPGVNGTLARGLQMCLRVPTCHIHDISDAQGAWTGHSCIHTCIHTKHTHTSTHTHTFCNLFEVPHTRARKHTYINAHAHKIHTHSYRHCIPSQRCTGSA
jgi:hypothetical protein